MLWPVLLVLDHIPQSTVVPTAAELVSRVEHPTETVCRPRERVQQIVHRLGLGMSTSTITLCV